MLSRAICSSKIVYKIYVYLSSYPPPLPLYTLYSVLLVAPLGALGDLGASGDLVKMAKRQNGNEITDLTK